MDVALVSQEKKNHILTFVLNKSTAAFANAIRRCALEGVPTLAIEEVEFRKNTSVLYDEVIAHRLGLLPIKTDLKSYNLSAECSCAGNGCAQCQLTLSLKEKGPKTVYAEDIVPKDPNAKLVFPKTPIVKLLKNQTFEAEMTAKLGTGKTHAKWSPGRVYYKYMPEITITKKGESCLQCIEACPQGVFEKKGEKLSINKDTLINCHLCGACEDVSHGEVSLNKEVENFVFYIESWGQLGCEEIIMKASEQVDKKLDAFSKALGETAK